MSTYKVNHSPHLQLGDAPLDGFKGSETDQVELMWQTVPGGGSGTDSFVVEYRLANSSGPWSKASGSREVNPIGSGGRVNHSVEMDGLAYNTEYEYRVQHFRGNTVVETFQDTFQTRLKAGDNTSFSFAAYGDSAYRGNIGGFRSVQNRINQSGVDFSLLLGDNIYDSGSQTEADLRFDRTINPEAAEWTASHIDYVAFGNHDVRTDGGDPTEDNYSVPIPQVGIDSLVAPPSSETPEHNYSFDYGNVHFVTFDTNALDDARRLDGILDWVEADLAASDAQWKVVFGHHPVSGGPEKPEKPSDNYYKQVVSRFNAAGVDLFLAGHTHTVSWTYPLLGEQNGKATFVKDMDKDYEKGAGLVQGIFGTGGKSLRSGNFDRFPFIAQGYTSTTKRRSEDGFAKIDVTENQLKVSYVAADDGEIIDSFTITDNNAPDSTAPTVTLRSPIDNGPNDLNPGNNAVTLNKRQSQFQFQLKDIGDGIDDQSVTKQTVTVTRNGRTLTESTDYAFSYNAGTDMVTINALGGDFSDGMYQVTLSNGAQKITDKVGNPMSASSFKVEIDSTIAPPQTISFQQGVNGYTGTVDTLIQGASPNTQHGSDLSLNVDGSDRGSEVQALMKFADLFGNGNGQIDPNAQIKSAKLELQVTNPGNSFELHRMLTNWSNNSTWNSLGGGVQTNDVEALIAADAKTGTVGTGPLSIDVTSSLRAWQINPQSNFGWAFTSSGGHDGVDFNSAEGTIAPRLVVEYVNAPVDPPTGNTVEVSFQQGVNNFNGAVDTYINSGSAKKHGSAKTLRVDGETKSGHIDQTLLRFDDIFGQGTGQIDPNAQIESASLQLNAINGGDSVELHRMLTNWSGADTWSSLGNGIQADGVEATASAEAISGAVGAGLQSFDVTASLKAWLANPSSNYGWAILPTGTDGVNFNSSEGAIAPRLVVKYSTSSTPPTPTPVGKTIIGNANSEQLQGGAGNDLIQAGHGDDTVAGLAGDDTLYGGVGIDTIAGGAGNDRISGGQKGDQLSGGAGADIFAYRYIGHGGDTISDFDVRSDKFDVSDIFTSSKYGSANIFNDYIQVVGSTEGAKVQLDLQGDAGDQFKTLATLQGVDANSLNANHFIV